MLRVTLIVIVLGIISILVPYLISESRAATPALGTAAPDFTLPSQQSAPVSLKDYRGNWIVLYFYPKDQTPGCTREAHNFQVSVDSVDSHKKFCAKEGLNFKLLADRDGKVSQAYGSLTDLAVVKFARRNTFLIDPSGKVAKTYTSVNPARHSEEVLAALDQLRKQ